MQSIQFVALLDKSMCWSMRLEQHDGCWSVALYTFLTVMVFYLTGIVDVCRTSAQSRVCIYCVGLKKSPGWSQTSWLSDCARPPARTPARTSHPTRRLDHSSSIFWRVQIINVTIIQFFFLPPGTYPNFPSSRYSPLDPVPKYLQFKYFRYGRKPSLTLIQTIGTM